MILQIRGDHFATDHKGKALTNVERGVTIPYAIMEQRGFNMRFLYDDRARTFFNGDWSQHPTDKHIAMIRVPSPDRLKKMDQGLTAAEKAWELPKVSLGADRFFVDALARELIEVRSPGNCISFEAMSDKITHLELAYDTKHKTAFQGKPDEIGRNPSIQRVQIPSMIRLDPEFMREVIKPAGFGAQQEVERRIWAFDQQWNKYNKQHTSSETRTKTKLKR